MKNNCFKYNTTSPSLKNTINFGKFPYINSAISLSQKKKILSRFRVNDLYGTLKIRYHKFVLFFYFLNLLFFEK